MYEYVFDSVGGGACPVHFLTTTLPPLEMCMWHVDIFKVMRGASKCELNGLCMIAWPYAERGQESALATNLVTSYTATLQL